MLQKSFWGGERKILEPLMRFARGDVRDHIASSKIDHGPPQWRWKATQQQRSPKISFREIFTVVRFSTFATKSAKSCPWQARNPTSAFPPETDSTRKSQHVRKVPEAGITTTSLAQTESLNRLWLPLATFREEAGRAEASVNHGRASN
jgi:hypothetical protein